MKVGLAVAAFAMAMPGAAWAQELDLVEFFLGKTRAQNEVKIAFRKPVRQVTDTIGKKAANGDFIIVDTIREEGKPVKTRRWVMRPAGPNRFTGTMSDAVSAVTVRIDGKVAHLQYKVKGGITVEQTLTMRDRKTLMNHVAAKKLGVRLGRLDGVIRKVD